VTAPAQKRPFGVKDLAEFRVRIDELRSRLQPPTLVGDYVAHTDGGCLGNPEGPGGWAAVVDRPDGGAPWLLCGHLSSTSNNRAEALAILAALEWLPPDSRLALFSDSELSVRILSGRYKVRANTDIWDLIFKTISEKRVSVAPEWLRGHAGDPRNELADRLTRLAAASADVDCSAVDVSAVAELADRNVPPELAGLEPRTDWEREFLSSVADQLKRGRELSDKQRAVIERMRTRPPRTDSRLL
jgi:ribonuclease HI